MTVLVEVPPEISLVMIINTQALGESQKEGDRPRIDKLGREVVWDFANLEIKFKIS